MKEDIPLFSARAGGTFIFIFRYTVDHPTAAGGPRAWPWAGGLPSPPPVFYYISSIFF